MRNDTGWGHLRRTLIRPAAALAIGALTVTLMTVAGPARAEERSPGSPASCRASEAEIYAPQPASVRAPAGTVLACRQVFPVVTSLRPTRAFQVRYVTTDLNGIKRVSTGIAIVPITLGFRAPRLVGWSSATVGLGSRCAASRQLALGGYQDDVEVPALGDFINDGYAVALSDGFGYVEGSTHTYVVGTNNGHAQLDMVRAARQLPRTGLDPDGDVVLYGFSEGGHSVLWATQLAASYAPELRVVGSVAGDPASDLRATATQLNGSLYMGFLGDSVLGINAAYPQLPLDSIANEEGRAMYTALRDTCAVGTLAAASGGRIEDLTVGNKTLEELYEIAGPDGLTWGQALDAQKVAVDVGPAGSPARYDIGFPVLIHWSDGDEVIPPASIRGAVDRYCAAGVAVREQVSTGIPHAVNQLVESSMVRDWIADRFAGRTDRRTC
jgi:triacylglycerol lipase